MTEQVSPSRSTALFVGHPGHELRLYGWMRREKPICMVLTTGSRFGSDTARLQASSDLLTTLGGRPSELFGAVLDRDLYAAVLAGDTKPFLKWKATVVDVLIRNRPELLVIDGWQLYSVTHDLAHVIGRLAAEEASRKLSYPVQVLQYDVVPPALAGGVQSGSRARVITLSKSELADKLAAVENYPGIDLELIELREIEGEYHAITESLFLPPPLEDLTEPPREPPKYEIYGEARRSSGIYTDVIRWHHVETIIRQLIG
jgi:hypothetical protein